MFYKNEKGMLLLVLHHNIVSMCNCAYTCCIANFNFDTICKWYHESTCLVITENAENKDSFEVNISQLKTRKY